MFLMLECELYLVIAILTGSSISWVDTVFFSFSSIPSIPGELVIGLYSGSFHPY